MNAEDEQRHSPSPGPSRTSGGPQGSQVPSSSAGPSSLAPGRFRASVAPQDHSPTTIRGSEVGPLASSWGSVTNGWSQSATSRNPAEGGRRTPILGSVSAQLRRDAGALARLRSTGLGFVRKDADVEGYVAALNIPQPKVGVFSCRNSIQHLNLTPEALSSEESPTPPVASPQP